MTMETVDLAYRIKTADTQEILEHLKKCDHSFQPILTKRVNIEEYARKIFDRATTFEAWHARILVGLLAAYFSNNPERSAFITNVSVLEDFMGKGIASRLLNECKEYALQENFGEIRLEVHKVNVRAIGLYRKLSFVPYEIREDFLIMRLALIDNQKSFDNP